MKTELKKSCSKCKYADWDADGCTCMIEKRLIGNAFAYVCDNFSSAKPLTNGDCIRRMTDEELLDTIGTECYRCIYGNGECDNGYGNGCFAGNLEWLKQEATE